MLTFEFDNPDEPALPDAPTPHVVKRAPRSGGAYRCVDQC
jgi:hypothetical protein